MLLMHIAHPSPSSESATKFVTPIKGNRMGLEASSVSNHAPTVLDVSPSTSSLNPSPRAASVSPGRGATSNRVVAHPLDQAQLAVPRPLTKESSHGSLETKGSFRSQLPAVLEDEDEDATSKRKRQPRAKGAKGSGVK